MGGPGLGVNDYLSVRAGVVATRAYRVVYLSVRAGVVATRAYRVVQQQGYLGFEGLLLLLLFQIFILTIASGQ